MNAFFTRWLPCATLAIWSGVLLYYHYNEKMGNLLAPQFRTFAFAGGIVLALMALTFAIFRADASCCSANDCGHGLSRLNSGKLLTFIVLIFPISLAAKYNPGEFSANAVRNAIITTDATSIRGAADRIKARREANRDTAPQPLPSPEDDAVAQGRISDPPPLPLPTADGSQPPDDEKHPAAAESDSFSEYLQKTPDGNIMAEVLDLLYAAQDQVLRKDFEGRKVQLIVQYMPETKDTGGANRFKGVRMFMTCCAADARPIATLIEAEKLPDLPDMTWVKVIGTSTFPIEKGRRISIIKAERIEKTEPPEESMLY